MSRRPSLDNWLYQILGTKTFQCQPLAGDASFRRYYRIKVGNASYVLMDAPPPETPQVFFTLAETLAAKGLSVPKIIHHNFEEGFLLLSDFGDRLYLHELTDNTAIKLYDDALSSLISLHQIEMEAPVFDKPFLTRQFSFFKEWYLKKHCRIENTEMLACLDPLVDAFFDVIAEQPTVFVHRDYHSRNLMVIEQGSPGILDFQDAMRGPLTYDLVSLLQDCYIAWPRMKVENWVMDFHKKANDAGLLTQAVPKDLFLRWFDLTGLQRHLKNLGIFCRLYYRDQKPQYMKDLKLPLQYSLDTCQRYPEFQFLGDFLKKSLPEDMKCAL